MYAVLRYAIPRNFVNAHCHTSPVFSIQLWRWSFGRLTLVISFVSKGFPCKDQIEELFIVCIPNT